MSFIGRVRVEELEQAQGNVGTLLAQLTPGFRVLADLERMESMEADCTQQIGKFMEQCDQAGVGIIVRVIPDPTKDIGLTIMSRFHYRKTHPRMVTCQSMVEAAEVLSL